MLTVPDAEAQEVRNWLDAKGMKFVTGPNPETDLTDAQILEQCKMYISAARIADEFGCALIGIQYQQGLKDLSPASDLVEGLLNNVDRPPVKDSHDRVLFEGQAIPHFNEVDECAGVDALVTNRVWIKLGFAPETTLHDVRYGEDFKLNGKKEFVWVFEISGAVPPEHLTGGYAGSTSERQPAMYFRMGGGSIKGISKPGEIVWSRVFVDDGKLKVDIGRGQAVELPKEENERRWSITTSQWPMMQTITYGVTRNQFMARHKSNHIQVAYAPDAEGANLALAAKAAMFRELGVEVSICGTNHGL
jgi:hypothetical protein